MDKIYYFRPIEEHNVNENLQAFIRKCKFNLTVFGHDLDWEENYWPNPGVTFTNLNQKSRIIRSENVLKKPYIEFAKAYLRYQQGHKKSKSLPEIRALKCLERALDESENPVDIQNISLGILDYAMVIARQHYSARIVYHVGRELERLARFICKNRFIIGNLDWKNPARRVIDTVRTGKKARQLREKKVVKSDVLDALAKIFADNPTGNRDIFTSSVSAMLLCAPSRISEVIALPCDCEVTEKKRDGCIAYGWRFIPGKGGIPMIKWIPSPMVTIAQEAIKRIRMMTDEARRLATWYEQDPCNFYRHANCPDVSVDQPLSKEQIAAAVGIDFISAGNVNAFLRKEGLPLEKDSITLLKLANWARKKLPNDFPWFDKERNIKYCDALFCLQFKQLRTDMGPSPILLTKPSNNSLTFDLQARNAKLGYQTTSIFDRHGIVDSDGLPLKATSHQFRHLLNTMAQRGGLSQSEIARWSGRINLKQNRVYDHMSEFELVDMLRTHDPALTMDRPLREIAQQITSKSPMTRQEFNVLATPTAHITEFGFCTHDFVMMPCQRFRDCLNCTEQVCIKGDKRIKNLRLHCEQLVSLKVRAEEEIKEGTAGADRWYEITILTINRVKELIKLLENTSIPDGSVVRLRNDHEYSPLRRILDTHKLPKKNKKKLNEALMISDLRQIMDDSDG